MTDKELIQRLRQGDESAFEMFYKEYASALANYVRRKVSDKSAADELVNKIFFSFFEALRDFKNESSLKTFLFSIARYKVIDYYRRKKIKKVFLSNITLPFVNGVFFLMDDDIQKQELVEKIDKTFSILPKKYHQILRLKYIEGLRVSEIANKLKMSFKATESLLFRARQAFVKVFKSEYGQ
ncbi:MAG: DNA-directed RNA polymerase sigma-70 factor [Patescibacteria group bacterium]|nr:MAG: DNA-directed RNA polymerase sigma-70 factor [Patescibacteria group bacterium]